jgi:AraC-like DNA-binding protein
MNPIERYYAALRDCLHELSLATHTHILWRSAALADRSLLPDTMVVHQHPFCVCRKATPEGLALCRHDCDLGEDHWRNRTHASLIRTCHAGARECIVPIWEENQYRGCYFVGIFHDGTRLSMEDEAAGLEPADDTHMQHVAAVVCRQHSLLHPLREAATAIGAGVAHPAIRGALERLASSTTPAQLRAGSVAKEVGLSRSRFVHLFREVTGTTFTLARQRATMERARHLLCDSVHSIRAVAERCGYGNQHNFAAAFKREMGCSPSSFRKRCRQRDQV